MTPNAQKPLYCCSTLNALQSVKNRALSLKHACSGENKSKKHLKGNSFVDDFSKKQGWSTLGHIIYIISFTHAHFLLFYL